MIKLSGFTEVTYSELQKTLQAVLASTEITKIQIASKLEVTNTVTVINAFNADLQLVSDARLSKLFDILKIKALIVYFEGSKKYFVETGNPFLKKSKIKDSARV